MMKKLGQNKLSHQSEPIAVATKLKPSFLLRTGLRPVLNKKLAAILLATAIKAV
jgi:hypothetical protein